MKFDFGWGNPYFLLEILDRLAGPLLCVHNIKEMTYAPDNGMDRLIEQTSKAIEESCGIKYDYVAITAGATQGLNSIMKLSRNDGFEEIITLPHGYPFYADIIESNGLTRICEENPFEIDTSSHKRMFLIDSPSNPQGRQLTHDRYDLQNITVWDGVYQNPIYTKYNTLPPHLAMVGSYSKLLGLTGARVGWIATNDEEFFKNISYTSLKDNATVSVPSQEMVSTILDKIDLAMFMKHGQSYLDLNREVFQKIEYLFDGQEVNDTGMFYCANATSKALKVLEKAEVRYVDLGNNCIRLSMGQTSEMVKEGIKAILRKDGK